MKYNEKFDSPLLRLLELAIVTLVIFLISYIFSEQEKLELELQSGGGWQKGFMAGFGPIFLGFILWGIYFIIWNIRIIGTIIVTKEKQVRVFNIILLCLFPLFCFLNIAFGKINKELIKIKRDEATFPTLYNKIFTSSKDIVAFRVKNDSLLILIANEDSNFLYQSPRYYFEIYENNYKNEKYIYHYILGSEQIISLNNNILSQEKYGNWKNYFNDTLYYDYKIKKRKKIDSTLIMAKRIILEKTEICLLPSMEWESRNTSRYDSCNKEKIKFPSLSGYSSSFDGGYDIHFQKNNELFFLTNTSGPLDNFINIARITDEFAKVYALDLKNDTNLISDFKAKYYKHMHIFVTENNIYLIGRHNILKVDY